MQSGTVVGTLSVRTVYGMYGCDAYEMRPLRYVNTHGPDKTACAAKRAVGTREEQIKTIQGKVRGTRDNLKQIVSDRQEL